MNIEKTEGFAGAWKKLPQDIQRLCKIQEKRCKENWRDPRLHVKKVRGMNGVFSFRITRRYRAFFYFHTPDTLVFFEIDHRKDIYRE